jgi:hypothetical protein
MSRKQDLRIKWQLAFTRKDYISCHRLEGIMRKELKTADRMIHDLHLWIQEREGYDDKALILFLAEMDREREYQKEQEVSG